MTGTQARQVPSFIYFSPMKYTIDFYENSHVVLAQAEKAPER
jgi:hypothetical protein